MKSFVSPLTEPVVVLAEEGLGAAIAALGDVVRDAGEHGAG
jgi:hypothetical protein